MLNDERLAKTIYACCVLSNICINQNDPEYVLSDEFQGFEEFTNRGENIEVGLDDLPSNVNDESEDLEDLSDDDDDQDNVRPTQAQIERSKRAGELRRERIKIELSQNVE